MFCCVRNLLRTIAVVTCFVGGATCVYPVYAANSDAPTLVIRHAKVFDGRSLTLLPDHAILISGNRIVSVLPDPGVATTTWQSAHIIDANGRVVTPGLIDAHVHTTVVVGIPRLRDSDPGYLAARSGAEAHAMLMRGFTTIRDMAGPAFGLQQAIDEGVLEGPRIFPSGAMIGQTSGHADLRQRGDTPSRRWTGRLDALEERGYVLIADGPDEVQAGVRERSRDDARSRRTSPCARRRGLAGPGQRAAHDQPGAVRLAHQAGSPGRAVPRGRWRRPRGSGGRGPPGVRLRQAGGGREPRRGRWRGRGAGSDQIGARRPHAVLRHRHLDVVHAFAQEIRPTTRLPISRRSRRSASSLST